MIKVCIAGETSVGKTSIMNRIVNKNFNEYTDSTIGASFNTHIVIQGNKELRINFWDTAGQERYNSLLPMYFRGSQVILLVASVDGYSDSIKKCVELIKKTKTIDSNFKYIFILNKIDLLSEKNDELKYIVEIFRNNVEVELGYKPNILQVSAKQNKEIHEIPILIAEINNSIKLDESKSFIDLGTKSKKKGCCGKG